MYFFQIFASDYSQKRASEYNCECTKSCRLPSQTIGLSRSVLLLAAVFQGVGLRSFLSPAMDPVNWRYHEMNLGILHAKHIFYGLFNPEPQHHLSNKSLALFMWLSTEGTAQYPNKKAGVKLNSPTSFVNIFILIKGAKYISGKRHNKVASDLPK